MSIDKIKAIRIKQLDGTYSDEIPIIASMESIEGLSTILEGKADKSEIVTYENKPALNGGTDVSLVTTGDKYRWNNSGGGGGGGTTYENKPAAAGGTDVSLVLTGDKYIWNNKADASDIETYENKAAADGGTDVSLVTTGDKYTWNNKSDLKKTESTKILTVAGWSSKSQSLTVTGVTATNSIIVGPTPDSIEDWCASGVICTAQAANTLTFTCDEVPEAAINVNIMILDDN